MIALRYCWGSPASDIYLNLYMNHLITSTGIIKVTTPKNSVQRCSYASYVELKNLHSKKESCTDSSFTHDTDTSRHESDAEDGNQGNLDAHQAADTDTVRLARVMHQPLRLFLQLVIHSDIIF